MAWCSIPMDRWTLACPRMPSSTTRTCSTRTRTRSWRASTSSMHAVPCGWPTRRLLCSNSSTLVDSISVMSLWRSWVSDCCCSVPHSVLINTCSSPPQKWINRLSTCPRLLSSPTPVTCAIEHCWSVSSHPARTSCTRRTCKMLSFVWAFPFSARNLWTYSSVAAHSSTMNYSTMSFICKHSVSWS